MMPWLLTQMTDDGGVPPVGTPGNTDRRRRFVGTMRGGIGVILILLLT